MSLAPVSTRPRSVSVPPPPTNAKPDVAAQPSGARPAVATAKPEAATEIDPALVAPPPPKMDIKPVQVAIAAGVGVTLAALCFAFIPFGWAALLVLLIVAPATITGALWGSEMPQARPQPRQAVSQQPTRAPQPKALDTQPAAAPVRALQPPKPVEIKPVAREQSPYEKYSAMVLAAGGTLPTEGKPTVLAIRNEAPAAARDYHDKIVVLLADGTATEFTGSTYPGQTASPAAKDANKDGVGDVGIVRPGNYVALRHGSGFWVQTTDGSGNLPGWRDTNHDGVYSDEEMAASEKRGDIVDQILFHAGASDEQPLSIGCMNLPTSAWPRFKKAVGNQSFNFTLIQSH